MKPALFCCPPKTRSHIVAPLTTLALAIGLAGCFEIRLDVETGGEAREDHALTENETIEEHDADLELRETTIELPGGDEVDVLYAVVDGRAMLTEDIVLGDANDLPFRASTLASSLWPDATITYRLDDSLRDEHFPVMYQAMAEWTALTGLKFVEADPGAVGGFVRIKADKAGCFATLGAPGPYEEHRLNIGPNCNSAETWRHEFGHTIGMLHEQSRSDRDDYVVIDWSNIKSGKAYAFDKYEARGIAGVDRGTYDYDSVMHYHSWSFSVDGSATIWTTGGELIRRDNDTPISAGDAAAVIAMYDLPVPGSDGIGEDVGSGSCVDACGSELEVYDEDGFICYCDEVCTEYEDCCDDYTDVCDGEAEPANSSCVDHCGDVAPSGECYCDAECTAFGDCCEDFAAECTELVASCVDRCGDGEAVNGCYCDALCEEYEDCCDDYGDVCE